MSETQRAAWIRLAIIGGLVAAVAVVARPPRGSISPTGTPQAAASTDRVRTLQAEAAAAGRAEWGHWGDQPERYVSWSNHSNRLIPVYAFGTSLAAVTGTASVYRDADRIAALYGRLPAATLNESAEYCDNTDVHHLQLAAADAGKKCVIVVVFDGLDWWTTRAAAIATTGRVAYDSGRGTGLVFQDYRGTTTDFGFCVTSPANDGTRFDVDAQTLINPGGRDGGGYDPRLGGATPWDGRVDLRYLTGRRREQPHAVTDSSAAASALFSGRKTYNDAVNVAPDGTHVEPIAVTLQKRGWAVGTVTSVPFCHATPACTYANNVSRDDYQDIARDMLGERSVAHRTEPLPGLDLVIGGGFGVDAATDEGQGANFERGNKYLAASTLTAIDAARGGRYEIATRTPGRSGRDVLADAARAALAADRRLFGFFGTADGHLPFQTADGDFAPLEPPPPAAEADRLKKKYSIPIRYAPTDLTENPTLADMTRAALDFLGTRDRFWLLVEAGEVDWASHANNIDNCIGAIKSGNDAVRAIFDWVETHDAWADTAVIVTADHGHLFVLTDPTAFTK